MGPVGGAEILVILLVALIVLGPQRLPDAARQVGKAMSELRRLSNGFQQEMRAAIDEATETEARERGAGAGSTGPGDHGETPGVAPAANGHMGPAGGTGGGNGATAPRSTGAAPPARRRRAAPLRAPRK